MMLGPQAGMIDSFDLIETWHSRMTGVLQVRMAATAKKRADSRRTGSQRSVECGFSALRSYVSSGATPVGWKLFDNRWAVIGGGRPVIERLRLPSPLASVAFAEGNVLATMYPPGIEACSPSDPMEFPVLSALPWGRQ